MRPAESKRLHGAVLSGFLDAETAAAVIGNRGRFGGISSGRLRAGVEYPSLIEGLEDFVLFWRTLPWDHAPGALLVEEAGGTARRPDGSRYSPTVDGAGLLVAADDTTWSIARELLG